MKKYLLLLVVLQSNLCWAQGVNTYISTPIRAANFPETQSERESVDNQVTEWKNSAILGGACDIAFANGDFTNMIPRQYDGMSGNLNTVDLNILSTNIIISNRDMNGPVLGNPGGDLLLNALFFPSDQMQDNSPRPQSFYNSLNQFGYYSEISGDLNSENAILFEFDTPIRAFGGWFADLESRQFNSDASDASSAIIRYFDAFNQQIGSDLIIPSDTEDENNCGSSGINQGCGDRSTRFIGFTTDDVSSVAKMLVIVGSADDFGSAFNQHISFIGPTLVEDFDCPSCTVAELSSTYNTIDNQSSNIAIQVESMFGRATELTQAGICPDDFRRTYKKTLKKINRLYLQVWTKLWQLPQSNASCEATPPNFCSEVAISANRQFLINRLNKQINLMQNLFESPCLTGLNNFANRYKVARKSHRTAIKLLNDLPAIMLSC